MVEAIRTSESEAERLAALATAIRESTLKRLRAVPVDRENWRPAAGALSFAEIAQHLIDADVWLFRKIEEPETPSMTAVAGGLRLGSRRELEERIERLAGLGARRTEWIGSLTARDLARVLPDDRFGGEAGLWWILVRGNLDHEAHHRGQLATYLRMVALS